MWDDTPLKNRRNSYICCQVLPWTQIITISQNKPNNNKNELSKKQNEYDDAETGISTFYCLFELLESDEC